MEYPHRVVGDALNGLANSVEGIGNSAVRTVEDVGESVMDALDKPFTEITGMEGPHRAVDKAAKGAIDAGVNFASRGIIGSVRSAGEGIMKALDHPLEQIGKGKFEFPDILKK